MNLLGSVQFRVGKLWSRLFDPRRIAELSDERVVFHRLLEQGFLAGLEGKRILEIGPKHGQDSVLLATLRPGELVLLDLPEKAPMVRKWLQDVSGRCPTRYVEANILYMTPEEYQNLGTFDLIWALGVLYHNVEQVRLLKRLFDLCSVDGRIVIESATTRDKTLEGRNAVEVCWPRTYRDVPTITHLPSRLAIKSWLEMVGFADVTIRDVYSRAIGWQRAVLSGTKRHDARPYRSYGRSDLNPTYLAGDGQ